MITGVSEAICACGKKMIRTGGKFGGNSPTSDTYYCGSCKKHVIIITPNQKEQQEFTKRYEDKLEWHAT